MAGNIEPVNTTESRVLGKGTKIYPDPRKEDYYLEVIEVRDNVLTVRDSRSKQQQIVTPQKRLTIGRMPTNHIRINEYDDVYTSRLHGAIEYEPAHRVFLYRHNGLNVAGIDQSQNTSPPVVPEICHENLETVGGSKEGAQQVILLKHGMLINMRYDIPQYKVEMDGGSVSLIRQDPDPKRPITRYPEKLTFRRGQTGYIGSDLDLGKDRFPQLAMSRTQSIIFWDKESQEFILSNTGALHFTTSFGKAFFQEQNEINEKLALLLGAARIQLASVKRLIREMTKAMPVVERVKQLENATVCTPLSQLGGAYTEDSQKGYELWLRAYLKLYDGKLEPEDKDRLRHMAKVVKQLGEDREFLRKIENDDCRYELPPYAQDRLAHYNYAQKMESYAHSKAEALERDGEVYIPAGYRGHHVVARIKKEGSGYTLTTYNAGGEARLPPPREDPAGELVMVQYDQALKLPDPQRLIRLLSEKKLRARSFHGDILGYDALCKDMDAMLDKPGRHRNGKPQGKGNCTTRSTREALQDALGDSVFSDMHKHISDPNAADAKDVLEALERRAHALQVFIERESAAEAKKMLGLSESAITRLLATRPSDSWISGDDIPIAEPGNPSRVR